MLRLLYDVHVGEMRIVLHDRIRIPRFGSKHFLLRISIFDWNGKLKYLDSKPEAVAESVSTQ